MYIIVPVRTAAKLRAGPPKRHTPPSCRNSARRVLKGFRYMDVICIRQTDAYSTARRG